MKIPRTEVELHAQSVCEVANSVTNGGVHYTICGGYRRGKAMSGDIDIVLTHESIYGHDNLLQPLLAALSEQHIIETVITVSRKTVAVQADW